MKILGLILMMPFILQICGVILVLFVSSQLKKRGINPEDFKGKGVYDKGYSFFSSWGEVLVWVFLALFIVGLMLYS